MFLGGRYALRDRENNVRISTFNRIVRTLDASVRALGGEPLARQLESMAILIYEVMSAETRDFHDVEHVFDVAGDGDPIEVLAGLFHDVVYHGVDHGFPQSLRPTLVAYVTERRGALTLRPERELTERTARMTLEVFGLAPGMRLDPAAGQNEALSALVATRLLGPMLRAEHLVQIAGCIEATIPFRRPDENGRTCSQQLAERLHGVCAKYGVALDADTITDTVRKAALMANRDVGGFAADNAGEFLVGTWRLYPENNPQLRIGGLYTICDYRSSLLRTERFLSGLDPAHIFRCYRGVPTPEDMEQKRERARRNLAVARRYLRIKLYAAAMLEALAEISGGDAPISMFMGDIRRRNEKVLCMEDHLIPGGRRPLARAAARRRNSELYRLLALGRSRESSFDTRHSPLSTYLVDELGEEAALHGFEMAERLFARKVSAADFLDAQDPAIVAATASACAHVALTRREKLLSLAQEMQARIDASGHNAFCSARSAS